MASTGSLGDYLGLPTTLVGNYGNRMNFSPVSCSADSNSNFLLIQLSLRLLLL